MRHMKNTMKFWVAWHLALLFYLIEFVIRISPASLVNELMQHYALSPVQLGVLSACFYASYALFQIPVGILFDRFNPIKLIIGAILILAFSIFIMVNIQNYQLACFARIVQGASSAFAFTGSLKIAHMGMNKRFSLLVGITNFVGVCIGALISTWLLSILTEYYLWQDIMLTISTILLANALLLGIFTDLPLTNTNSQKIRLDFTKDLVFWRVAFTGLLTVIPIAVYSELWAIEFLKEACMFSKEHASLINFMTFLGIGIGGIFFGILGNYYKNYCTSIKLSLIICLLSFMCITQFTSSSMFIQALLHLLLGISSSSMLYCFTINKELAGIYSGSSIAITNFIVMLGGALFQPLFGFLVESLTFELALLSISGSYIIGFYILPRKI